MYCPVCKSEYRPGFTRCAPCNTDLVEDLSRAPRADSPERPPTSNQPAATEASVPMVSYCGFLGLDEARHAREQLRREGIRSEIVIRDAPGSEPEEGPVQEEYWLRMSPMSFTAAARILVYDPAEDAEPPSAGEEELACSACGGAVGPDESFCPHCGERFEDGR